MTWVQRTSHTSSLSIEYDSVLGIWLFNAKERLVLGERERGRDGGACWNPAIAPCCSKREHWHHQCRTWPIRLELPVPMRKRPRGGGQRGGPLESRPFCLVSHELCSISFLHHKMWAEFILFLQVYKNLCIPFWEILYIPFSLYVHIFNLILE